LAKIPVIRRNTSPTTLAALLEGSTDHTAHIIVNRIVENCTGALYVAWH
jgi:hypothetical protein